MRTRFLHSLGLAAALLLAGCAKEPGQAAFDAGLREIKRGGWERARAHFEKALTLQRDVADHAASYNYLGLAAARLGRPDDARRAFEDSHRLDPALVDPVYNLGVLALEQGDAARALRHFEEAAAMDPKDVRALEFQASIHMGVQQWPAARRALYAAQARDPNSPRLRTMLAAVEDASGYPDRAEGLLLEALDRDGKYAPALFNLAVLNQTRTADPAHAAELFRKFLALGGETPQAAYARRALERGKPAPAGGAASAPPAAATAAAPARAAAPTGAVAAAAGPRTNAPPPPARGMDPAGVLAAAKRLADGGQPEQALALCQSLASSAEQSGRPDVQEKALAGAASVCFSLPQAHVDYGAFLLHAKRTEEALKAFKRAIALDVNCAPAHLGMARAATAAGELDAAIIGFRDAIRADPRSAEAYWGLAQLYDGPLDQAEPAARTYRDFAVLFPQDARTEAAKRRMQKLAPGMTMPVYDVRTAAPPARVAGPAAPAGAGLPAPARRLAIRAPAARNPAAGVQAYNRGVYYQQRHELDTAIQYYTRALENDDQLAEAFFGLGVAYGMKGDADLAKDGFLRALGLRNTYQEARYQLAWLYAQERDVTAATSVAAEILKADPRHAPTHQLLGYVYAQSPATHAQAKESYRKFLELAPASPDARAVRRWIETH